MHAEKIQMLIDGAWAGAASGETSPLFNPANAEVIAEVPRADTEDLDRALDAADRAFRSWKTTTAARRWEVLSKAADYMEQRKYEIACTLTVENGKSLAEAGGEVQFCADATRWYAEEAKRAYGRIIPARAPGVRQLVMKEPVGPALGFAAWNFPAGNVALKMAAALAAGCSIIVKPSDETPGTAVAIGRCFVDAGVPAGALNIVFGDANLDKALDVLVASKFRNAGQVCTSPTRFYVQEGVYDKFVSGFVERSRNIVVGDGMDQGTQMGPLITERRLDIMDEFVADAVSKGARIALGGNRTNGAGYFYQPTVLREVTDDARVMVDEPFGPLAQIAPFRSTDEVLQRANSLPLGLAAYLFTQDLTTASNVAEALEAGVVGVNHTSVHEAETPFGGVNESGYGAESGAEGLEAYLRTKMVSEKRV